MIKSVSWPLMVGKQDGSFKLERIEKALSIMENPEKKIPFPIHIVGTNGKGSTTAFLEAILKEAGFLSHVYTSPNLISLNERIKIAGRQISDQQLTELLNTTKELLMKENFAEEVSFFEGFTAAAFLCFSQQRGDFSLIEAGLGGRFDATNTINSKLCILTSVSFDHTEYLGETIQEIAMEKLAVAKGGTPFIIAKQPYTEVYNYAKNGILYGKDFHIIPNENGFEYISKHGKISLPKPSLIGEHQFFNASTAICACEFLRENYGYKITNENIINGLLNAVWNARMQKLNIKSFPNLEVFLDGAHNENGVETIISEINSTSKNYTKTYIICGFLRRKDLSKIIPKFANLQAEIYFTNIHSTQESRNFEELIKEFTPFNVKANGGFDNFYEALEKISISNKSARVIIFGSLYLAGEVLEYYL